MMIKCIKLIFFLTLFSCQFVTDDVVIQCCSDFKGKRVVHFSLKVDDIDSVDTINKIIIFNHQGVAKIGNTSGTLKEYFKVIIGGKLIGYLNINCNYSSNRAAYYQGFPFVECDYKSKTLLINKNCMQLEARDSVELENCNLLIKEIYKSWFINKMRK